MMTYIYTKSPAVPILFLCAICHVNVVLGQTVTQALYTPVDTLDPVYATTSESYVYSGNLFETLVVLGDDSEILPAQAKSWDISADGLEYTFNLREGIIWNDGYPVTAHDFVTAFQRLANPAIGQFPKPTYLLANIRNAIDILNNSAPVESLGVTAKDINTVVFTLNTPAAYFLYVLTNPALAPVPSHLVELKGNDWAEQFPLVSNGPYSLETKGESLDILTRNEGYWSNTFPDTVELIFYESQKSVMMDLMSGKLDIAADLPRSQAQWLAKSFPGQITDHLVNGTVYTMFNTDKEHLGDSRVRRALAMAVEKGFLVSRLGLQQQQAAHTFSAPTLLKTGTELRPEWMSRDFSSRQREARELLQEAGYGSKNPLNLMLLYSNKLHMEQVATFLKSAWGEIGVQVELELTDRVGLSPRLNARDYEVSLAGWFADFPHPMTFLSLLRSNASKNRTGWASAEYDDLLNYALTETDREMQADIYQELESLLHREAPIIPLFHPSFMLVTSGKIGEYRGHSYGLLARNVSLVN